MDAAAGKASLIKVVDPAPRQIPAPDAVQRALDLLKGAKRPLILLGKGAAYARADADIRALVEKTGIPYLPMSMAKGLLPDTHAQSASAARSYVLAEADVVMLVGARLNWLLSHGKGKTWGGANADARKFIQIDIAPTEIDSNVPIDAPLIGDIGSCVVGPAGRCRLEVGQAAGRMDRRDRRAQGEEPLEDGRDAGAEPVADELPQRAQRGARHHQEAPRRDARQRRRQHAGLHAQHRRHVPAAQAPGRRHLGHHGHRHGLRRRRSRRDRQARDRHRGRQRLRLLRHGSRDHLPLQPAGVRRRLQQQRRLQGHRRQPARRRRRAHRVRQERALRHDDAGLRRRRRQCHDAGRVDARP